MKHLPCIILARKNSKGLKNKNKAMLGNKPLIQYSIEYAKRTKKITHVVVSTDDLDIKKISERLNCDVLYPRSPKLSNDKAKSEGAIKNALEWYEKKYNIKTKYYCYLQVTEPLRPKNILDKCIKRILNNKTLDSVFAGFASHKNYWSYCENKKKFIMLSSKKNRYLPRQVKKSIYREDSGIALISKSNLIKNKLERIGKKIDIIKYDSIESLIDIHSKEDLKLAEYIIKLKKIKLRQV